MNWYLDVLYKMAAKQDSSAEAYLARIGVPEETISYVTTLNPELKRWAVGFLSRSPQTTVENLISQHRTQKATQPQQVVNKIPTPVLDARFHSIQEKDAFFKNIPKEYTQWVSRILNDKMFAFIPEEDTPRLINALKSFSNLKVRDNIPLEKDINKYRDLNQLETEISKFTGTGSKSGGYLQYNPLSLPGVQQVKTLKDGTQMFKISNADSLAKLGIGTKWCTREDYGSSNMSSRYINQYGFLYLFTKDGKPVIQMTPDLNQVMDVNDEQIPLPRELYPDFSEQLSKKTKIPAKTILQFASEEVANNPDMVLKAIKKNPSALMLASDSLRNNINIVLEAVKRDSDVANYASQELQDNDEFNNEVQRAAGNFEYDFGYFSEMEEDLTKAIYGGAREFGIEPSLIFWDFNFAYDAVYNFISKGRGDAISPSGVAGVLANAAYDSDLQNIKNGTYSLEKMKKKAFSLATFSRKHPRYNYDKSKKYIQDLIVPYLPQAKIEVEKNLSIYPNKFSTEEIDKRINLRAFELMQNDVEFDTSNKKSIDDFDLGTQQRFLTKAVNEASNISQISEKREKNDEMFYDHYDDSYDTYYDEPNSDDFENPDDYENALNKWEEERDRIRDENANYHRSTTFPWNFDDEIHNTLLKLIESKPIRLPTWINSFFKNSQYVPNILWTVRTARTASKKTKANGWYNMIRPNPEDLEN